VLLRRTVYTSVSEAPRRDFGRCEPAVTGGFPKLSRTAGGSQFAADATRELAFSRPLRPWSAPDLRSFKHRAEVRQMEDMNQLQAKLHRAQFRPAGA